MTDEIEITYDDMYSLDFQRSVCKMLCENIKFAAHYGELIKVEYFEDESLRIFLPIIKTYVYTYERELDLSNFMVLLDDYIMSHAIAGSQAKTLRIESKNMFRIFIKSEQFIVDKLISFCRRQEMKVALLKSVDILEKDGSYESVLSMIDKAVSIGSMDAEGMSYDDMEMLPEKYAEIYDPKKLIKTGFKSWDKAMLGGMAPGELHVVQAPPKKGKSSLGAVVGVNNVVAGKVVFHATLEIKTISVGMKYGMIMTGMTVDDIVYKNKELYKKKLKRFEKYNPKFHVNFWVEQTATALDVRAWISRVRSETGDSPDLIIIDYDDCLLPVLGATGEMYEDAGRVYADLIALGDYFKCPILTFAQPQRDAWIAAEDGNLVTHNQLAHSAKKAHRCTSISSLNFTKESKSGIFYLDINRRGEDNVKIPMKKDLSKCMLWEAKK
jgi:hypothetical protein